MINKKGVTKLINFIAFNGPIEGGALEPELFPLIFRALIMTIHASNLMQVHVQNLHENLSLAVSEGKKLLTRFDLEEPHLVSQRFKCSNYYARHHAPEMDVVLLISLTIEGSNVIENAARRQGYSMASACGHVRV